MMTTTATPIANRKTTRNYDDDKIEDFAGRASNVGSDNGEQSLDCSPGFQDEPLLTVKHFKKVKRSGRSRTMTALSADHQRANKANKPFGLD
jgi:hypothetical protein